LAKPYRAETKKLENIIAKYAQTVDIKKYRTKAKQQFLFKGLVFHDTDFYDNKIVPKKQAAMRLAQLALYKPLIFQTPPFISEALTDHEIALYTIPKLNKMIISNKIDSTIVSGNGEPTIEYIRYTPFNDFELNINSLEIIDYHEIKKLVADLEKIVGIKIEEREFYIGR
jgi:hypothetical protein